MGLSRDVSSGGTRLINLSLPGTDVPGCPGLRPGLFSVVPNGTGFWVETRFPGLRPGLLSVVPAGLFLVRSSVLGRFEM